MEYTTLASAATVQKTSDALKAHGFIPTSVADAAAALDFIKETIPTDSSVMNGSSTTLEQIGYIEYLKAGQHGWRNLHEDILKEVDPVKQSLLRRQSVVSDFYLGSAHAVTEDGQLVISSNSGSQLPHLAYTSPNLILIVSTQKIVPTLSDAFDRIERHVVPLEDERMKKAYGFGTARSKTLILHRENPVFKRSVRVVFVNEKLGF